ncbi:MAG: (Fe-S)-binding protein [FCB group bacterium]|jgi:Fe-S oxidoreductase
MVIEEESCSLTKDITLEKLTRTPEGRRVLTCIQCGTCVGTCPHGEYMDFPPRRIIRMFRDGLMEEVFQSDSILKCVTCYACTAKCPRDIRLTDVLLPLVKEQAIIRLPNIPNELQKSLEFTYRYGNPMGESGRKRANWLRDTEEKVPIFAEEPEPADYLWWVECYMSYYPRSQETTRALAKVFNRLNINFKILGNEEKCAGDCGRLSWEPGLSENLIDYNMAILEKYKFKKIVTHDPHALDAFNYRYKLFGFDYEIEHTMPMLLKHIDQLKPQLTKKLNYAVTYHDSCCLGRNNNIYDEPRELLKAIPGVKLLEMTHNRINSICCGGGGGGMYLDTFYKSKGMERLSDRRVKEAIETGAEVLAVACPYEISRFEDSLKVLGYDKKIMVKDVAELLSESLGD